MISVCLASYNGERHIKEQIDSILSQIGKEDELIISDDGSKDATLNIITDIDDKRIKLIKNLSKHGVNSNFENAIKNCSGNIIFLADQDDVWLPGKVEECLKSLKNHDCVVHDAIVCDGNKNIIQPSFFKLRNSKKGFFYNIYKNTYLGCCMAFKRNILEKALPIPKTKAFFHDNWIGGIADLYYNIEFIEFKGILFRRHENNTSQTAKKSKFSLRKKVFNRISQIYYTLTRFFD